APLPGDPRALCIPNPRSAISALDHQCDRAVVRREMDCSRIVQRSTLRDADIPGPAHRLRYKVLRRLPAVLAGRIHPIDGLACWRLDAQWRLAHPVSGCAAT